MLPDSKKVLEVFERMSLDNSAYFTFQNQDNIKVCVHYEKKIGKKDWSIWFSEHESHSKQILSSDHLLPVVHAFKINEEEFINQISNVLLLQAAFADEFIRQITDLFGKQAIQKSILDTQNFMDELSRSVGLIFENKIDEQDKKDENKGRFRIIK